MNGEACAHLSAQTRPQLLRGAPLALLVERVRHTRTQDSKKNLPFGRNAAEIMKTERETKRDPLRVIAMLDTCLRLAALNHPETAMG